MKSPNPSGIATAAARQTNSRLGVLLMLLGMAVFGGADAMAKQLTDEFHAVQIMWFRQLALVVGVVILLGIRGPAMLRTRNHKLQITRGVLAIGSGLLFITAIKYVPLADAVAASFVAPFFLTIFGALVLGEKVGIRRWSAVVIGFIGALVIIRPGSSAIHPAVMLVVLAALCFASRQVIGRLLSTTDSTITTIAYTAITAAAIMSIALPFYWQWPEARHQWLTLSALGLCAALGEVLVVKSLEVAEAAVVAPMHYTLLVWGTLYGYLFFNQLPDQWTWIGTAIIMTAGLYTLHRDRKA